MDDLKGVKLLELIYEFPLPHVKKLECVTFAVHEFFCMSYSKHCGSGNGVRYWSLYCKNALKWSFCLLSWQVVLKEPARFVIRSLVHQPFRCLNSNTASITKVHRKIYARLYPTAVILPDGSSFGIRYHEPRKIIKVF